MATNRDILRPEGYLAQYLSSEYEGARREEYYIVDDEDPHLLKALGSRDVSNTQILREEILLDEKRAIKFFKNGHIEEICQDVSVGESDTCRITILFNEENGAFKHIVENKYCLDSKGFETDLQVWFDFGHEELTAVLQTLGGGFAAVETSLEKGFDGLKDARFSGGPESVEALKQGIERLKPLVAKANALQKYVKDNDYVHNFTKEDSDLKSAVQMADELGL